MPFRLPLAAALASAALVASWLPNPALADLVITVESRDLRSTPPHVDTHQAFLTADKLRMEIASSPRPAAGREGKDRAGKDEGVLIYRGDLEQLWILQPSQKSYLVLDKETMANVSKQLDDAMKQMEEQLAQLPEDQRRMVQEMMQGKMGAPGGGAAKVEPVAVELVKTDRRQTIEGYPCVGYERRVDGAKQGEVWVTSWDQAGVGEESFAAYKRLARFFQEMMEAAPMMSQAEAANALLGMDQIEGYPVLTREFEGDTPVFEGVFKSVERKKLDPGIFEIPAGFTEQKMSGATPPATRGG